MRPQRTRSRVRGAFIKLEALAAMEAQTKLVELALAEAVMHQMQATWLALIRQIADSQGIKPESVSSLSDLVICLKDRNLISVEANELRRILADPDSWASLMSAEYINVTCPQELQFSNASNAIPSLDRSGLTAIRVDRYRSWIDELRLLIESMQSRFDEF